MLPIGFPDKDDVVSAIFEDLLTGVLKREDVKGRVQTYIASHNRMYPTKYAKFGSAQLFSLDEVLFEDGSTTRGDTVSRGLWDYPARFQVCWIGLPTPCALQVATYTGG